MRKGYNILYIFIVIIIVLDQLTKYMIVKSLEIAIL